MNAFAYPTSFHSILMQSERSITFESNDPPTIGIARNFDHKQYMMIGIIQKDISLNQLTSSVHIKLKDNENIRLSFSGLDQKE